MCQYLKGNQCNLMMPVLGTGIDVTEDHCRICMGSSHPMSLNHVTCSLAISHLRKAGKLQDPKYHGLFTCVKATSPLIKMTQDLWAELHTKVGADELWFMDWFNRVPQIGCNCQEGASKILERLPPVYGEGWFVWSVAFHNEVNLKLNKRTWGLEEARRKWLTCCPSKKCS